MTKSDRSKQSSERSSLLAAAFWRSKLLLTPFLAGLDPVNNDYHVWIHEKGVNQIYENNIQPIGMF